MVSPRSRGDGKHPAEDEFLDVGGVPTSPPMKRMRGSVTNKIASGHILGGAVKPVSMGEVPAEQCWAMVLYKPPKFLFSNEGNGEGFLPKPSAIRDCPPGMRIRGGRPMPPSRQAAPKPKAKRPKTENRKVDPTVVTILSDSESEENAGRPPHHSRPSNKKAEARTSERKQKAEHGEVNFVYELDSDAEPRTRVKYILQQYDNLRRLYAAQDAKAGGSGGKRADLRASSALMPSRCYVNGKESIYGKVPGVEVGDHYHYRMELLLISLHRQSQAGIDFIPANKSHFRDKDGRPMSVAVSVIASGGYEDDKDEGDTLIYTGQGGNHNKSNKLQELDQELVRGNLALRNSREHNLSVRVVRGCDYKKSAVNQTPSGRIYYYDGLYDVVDCFQDKGSKGFNVWKFKLVRKGGQGPLSSNLVMFRGKSLPPVLRDQGERIVAEDLSRGQEPFKVRVVGSDAEDRPPDNFEYITSLRFAPGMPKPLPSKPCICSRECYERNGCGCILLNGDQPYNDEGGLLRAKKLIYECGPHCRCVPLDKCTNRVAQLGPKYELEVFKTKGKGWGVRSSYFIPQGSFVCEYIGEVIFGTDADKRVSNDEYMFDLKIPDSMERRFGKISGMAASSSDDDAEDDANCEFAVDANRCGNLSRFINHSCDPNLFVQCVLYDHHDHRFPHIMLFASEHISPYKELTYDYGYEIDTIVGTDGKLKRKNCYCGAQNCRGRLY